MLVSCFACIGLSAQNPPDSPAADAAIAFRRAAHLRHGINASEWFAQVWDPKGYTREHLEQHTTSNDLLLIRQMGFDHVRLSVNPSPMFTRGQADFIPAAYLGYLDAAVKMVLAQGLSVILDIHPESEFKQKLAGDDGFVEQFADFWRSLASHYSTWDPDRVFFEVLNEPEFKDRYRWYGVQARLVAAIRGGAPRHTIVVAGANWSDDDDMLAMEPLQDSNLIYNFHFYDPHIFTHQGATWGVNFWHFERGLPYPSSRDSAAKVAALVPDPMNQLYVLRYGLENWNAARIDAEIAMVAEWGKRRHVPLTCNEFGVYRAFSDPQDRARWISDVRSTLERYGIGWAMWDYSGGFGVVTKTNGQATPDSVTIKALGLQMPR